MISKQLIALFFVTTILAVTVSIPAYGVSKDFGSDICLKRAKYGTKSLELCLEGRKKK